MEQVVIDAFLNYFKTEPDGTCWFHEPNDIRLANELVKMGYLVKIGEDLGDQGYRLINSTQVIRTEPAKPAIVPLVVGDLGVDQIIRDLKKSSDDTARLVDALIKKVNG